MMKPGDHPEFFRFPAPEGRSRESTIRLDATGRFFHDDQEVEHPRLRKAMATWISRHPDDGRYILTNGYDWTYFSVEDVPFFVRSVSIDGSALTAELSDGTIEPLRAEDLVLLADGGVQTRVKREAQGGPFDAKFTSAALVDLAPVLEVAPDGSTSLLGQKLRANAK